MIHSRWFPHLLTFLFLPYVYISQAHNPNRGAASFLATLFRLPCVTQKYRRHSSTQPQIIVYFHETLTPRSARRRCEETWVHRSRAEETQLPGASAGCSHLLEEPHPLALGGREKSLFRWGTVKEWKRNAFFLLSVQHQDSSRFRYAQAQGVI